MIGIRDRDQGASAASDEAGPDGATPRSTADLLLAVAVVVALIPIVVATVRAGLNGWEPVGDNAYFLIRARDVFGENHPLLGTWTSASQNTDTNFNNPGPLLFDLLALPARLGGGMGLAVGVALLNGASVCGIAILVRRRAGATVALAAVAVTAVLCHSMGSQLLFDPWQPHALILPFLFCLTSVWAIATGDVAAAPWAAASASLIVQTHLSYAVILAALGGWAAVGLVLALRRRRADEPDRWPATVRSLRRVGLVTALVVAVCWSQPVLENLTAEGEGNLSRLAGNAAGSEETVGIPLGTRVVADTLVIPPAWVRPSFGESLRETDGDAATVDSLDVPGPVAALALTALAGALVAAAWWSRRRRDHVAAGMAVTALVSVAAALVTSWQLPFGSFGVAAHQFRWLWPLGAFTVLALLAAGVRGLLTTPRAESRTAIALAVVITVVAGANLPTHSTDSGPAGDEFAIEVMRRARPQMAALEGRGPIEIEFDGIRFAEPYTGPVMAELQRRDIPFVVSDEVLVRQLGEGRRTTGDADRLVFRDGDKVDLPLPGAERVVYVTGLEGADRRTLDDLRNEVTERLVADGLQTEDLSGAELDQPYLDVIAAVPEPGAVDNLLSYRILSSLVRRGLVVGPPEWLDLLARYVQLQDRSDQGALALYLVPSDG